MKRQQFKSNVGKTRIKHPFGNGLYHLCMVKLVMVSCCFTNIKKKYDSQNVVWRMERRSGVYLYDVVPCTSRSWFTTCLKKFLWKRECNELTNMGL